MRVGCMTATKVGRILLAPFMTSITMSDYSVSLIIDKNPLHQLPLSYRSEGRELSVVVVIVATKGRRSAMASL